MRQNRFYVIDRVVLYVIAGYVIGKHILPLIY